MGFRQTEQVPGKGVLSVCVGGQRCEHVPGWHRTWGTSPTSSPCLSLRGVIVQRSRPGELSRACL